jgi:hypothetical protein
MNTNYDANMIYQFLTQTPESGLRKMLIDKSFSDLHFGMLMKIVRSSPATQPIQKLNSTLTKST